MNQEQTRLLAILEREVVPALGCTEPIAVALAAAEARRLLGCWPEQVAVRVSPNLFKNGMGVGVPGTGMIGLAVAAACGVTGGDPDAGLQVLENLNPASLQAAKALLPAVTVDLAQEVPPLYAEVNLSAGTRTARVAIADAHTRIICRERDGVALDVSPVNGPPVQAEASSGSPLTVQQIFDFAATVPLGDIAFLLEGARMNLALAEEGLRGYGLGIGRLFLEHKESKLLSDDLMSRAIRLSSAASDARMAGAMLPAMSNSGSGNQGIAATLPVVAAAQLLGVDEERLVRAMCLSHLVAIHIKSHQAKLSALCAASTAAMGAGAGVTWLLGGDLRAVGDCISNMVGDVAGIICDGAGSACSMKVSTSVCAAVRAALMARAGRRVPVCEGIVSDDVEQTIANLGHLVTRGMRDTDTEIIRIMRAKLDIACS